MIESNATPDKKDAAITALRDSERHAAVRAEVPGNIGLTLVRQPVREIDGVSSQISDDLWRCGLKTPSQVTEATDAQLLAIRGIGPERLMKIRGSETKMRNGL